MDINDSPSLKLSSYADYILNCDKGAFMNDASQKSLFINKIVNNYWIESKAMTEPPENFKYQGNVPLRLQLDPDLSNELGGMIDSPSNKKIVNIYSYNNKFSAAKLIAAILEEYALLPFVERERIFYQNIYEILSSIIELNDSKNKKIAVCTAASGNSIKIYPVRIRMDEWSTHNYLLGLVYDENQKIKPICMRISRIKSVELQNAKSRFSEISDAHFSELDKAVNECGVMFLSTQSKIIEAEIRFSSIGKKMYDNMSFMRPPYTEREPGDNGECVMTFKCTERQILNYFRKFGKDAEVLSPPDLREQFLSFYAKAQEIYTDNFTED